MANTVDTARLRALAETVRDEREAVCAALKRGENASYRNLTEARWSLEELATIDATLLALLDELDTLRAGVATPLHRIDCDMDEECTCSSASADAATKEE